MLTIKQIFDKLYDIDYLTVGGVASMLYGVPRNTFDIDIMIFYTDAQELLRLIKELGYEKCVINGEIKRIDKVTPQAMVKSNVTMFIDGVKIDVITLGEPARKLWSELCSRAVLFEEEDTEINTIHIYDLIEMKRASGRPRDLEDIEILLDIMKSWPKVR